MTSQSKNWCFTVNNWTGQHEQNLEELAASQAVTYIVWGYETSSTGTPHLQGYVCFSQRLRFNAARGLLPAGTHLEAARGSPQQASDYCKKEGLFKEIGTLPLQGKRTDFDQFKEWVIEEYARIGRAPTEREIANHYPALFVRYRSNLLALADHLSPQVRYDDGDLFQWQSELYDILMQHPDDRKILFVVNEAGGAGKTWFQRYMLTKHRGDCQVLSAGKRDDVAHALDKKKSTFMFNIPRGGMEYMSYTVLEQLKDRMVFSPKYNSQLKEWHKNTHVVVFCNEMPDMSKMSDDRYYIIEL